MSNRALALDARSTAFFEQPDQLAATGWPAFDGNARPRASELFAATDALADADPNWTLSALESRPGAGLTRRAFVSQTLAFLAASVGITAACATYVAMLGLPVGDSIVCMLAGLFTLSGLLGANALGRRVSKWLSLPLMGLFSVLQGVAVGPIVHGYWMQAGGALIVAGALATTAIAFAAIGVYAFGTRHARRDFTALGGFLFAGAIVALSLSIATFYVSAPGLEFALAGVGAMVFTGYLLHDLSRLWTAGQDDPVIAALGLYINVLNVFLSLLRLFEFFVSGD
ncbi:protein of unknown function UPF0005 [Burkholderia vietnamiensis G4]|uniref:Bax inhibitor-1/YccA family protein n=1 Tax=Burkholderia vietnamiensis (strain G4 / LMG 22486) TaxID=269482 RepID=A4JFP5_BURVG|nr:protein of unknown function UPF0005 [Burkholderia vietnamiensis G4]